MRESTTARGRAGEDRAVLHLEREGYVVLARNVRTKGGELDVVAKDGEVLCFIEVRRRDKAEDALLSIDRKKQAQVARAAAAYLGTLSSIPRCRFDVVVVAGERCDLVRNAFEAPA